MTTVKDQIAHSISQQLADMNERSARGLAKDFLSAARTAVHAKFCPTANKHTQACKELRGLLDKLVTLG